MSIAFALAIYFIVWWIVLFAMLPIGVRTSEEAGEKATPGQAESAPQYPKLLPKMLASRGSRSTALRLHASASGRRDQRTSPRSAAAQSPTRGNLSVT